MPTHAARNQSHKICIAAVSGSSCCCSAHASIPAGSTGRASHFANWRRHPRQFDACHSGCQQHAGLRTAISCSLCQLSLCCTCGLRQPAARSATAQHSSSHPSKQWHCRGATPSIVPADPPCDAAGAAGPHACHQPIGQWPRSTCCVSCYCCCCLCSSGRQSHPRRHPSCRRRDRQSCRLLCYRDSFRCCSSAF